MWVVWEAVPELQIMTSLIGRWDVSVVQFTNAAQSLAVPVIGLIANSIYTS